MTRPRTARLGRWATLFAAAIVLAACGTTTPPTAPAVTNVEIDGGDATISVGQTVTLEATVTATGGAATTVTWASDDTSVATVSSTGELVGIAIGTAQITATSTVNTARSDTITVTVVDVDPANVFVNASAAPGGNGSFAFPYQTIADGVFFVTTGGTVNVAAGTYAESLYLSKPVVLIGAGESLVTIQATGVANGPFSVGAIDIDGIDTVNGLTLSGFTLDLTVAEADVDTAAAITIYRGATGVTIQDVTIVHTTDDESNVHGINLGGSVGTLSNVTLRRITIEAAGDLVLPNEYTNGAGVNVEGNVNGLLIEDLTTSGHERGVSLDPRNGTINDVEINTTTGIAEVNRMSVLYDGTGTVTNLDAPSFAAAVGNFTPEYGSNNWFFYKESINIAIRDSMFNFTEAGAWTESYVQELDAVDQSIRLPRFHIGQANGAAFGIGLDRNLLLQPAIDAAALQAVPATIVLQANVTSGALDPTGEPPVAQYAPGATVDVDDLTIEGAGGTSVLVADAGSVLTIDAANVTITDVTIDGPAATGITTTLAATGFSITGSNLLTSTGLDNTVEVAAVAATGNYWDAATGPTIASNPGGTGSALVDPGDDVTFVPFLAALIP